MSTTERRFFIDGAIKVTTLMGNVILDLPIFGNFLVPYCGIGFGNHWSHIRYRLEPDFMTDMFDFFEEIRIKCDGLVGQGIGGVTFLLGKKIHAAAEYRYLNGKNNDGNHTVDLSLLFAF